MSASSLPANVLGAIAYDSRKTPDGNYELDVVIRLAVPGNRAPQPNKLASANGIMGARLNATLDAGLAAAILLGSVIERMVTLKILSADVTPASNAARDKVFNAMAAKQAALQADLNATETVLSELGTGSANGTIWTRVGGTTFTPAVPTTGTTPRFDLTTDPNQVVFA